MKLSEFIRLLEKELKTNGDSEVKIRDFDTDWLCHLEDDCISSPRSTFNNTDCVVLTYDLEHN